MTLPRLEWINNEHMYWIGDLFVIIRMDSTNIAGLAMFNHQLMISCKFRNIVIEIPKKNKTHPID